LSNIIVELFIEQMNLDYDDSRSDIIRIRNYKAINVLFVEERYVELQNKIMDVKNDGVRFICEIVGINVVIKIFLFYGTNIDYHVQNTISKIDRYCEEFCRTLEKSDNLSDISSSDLLDKIIEEDGYLFRIDSLGVVKELSELLSSKKISYIPIRRLKSRFERGASSEWEEILIFIGQTMVSGLTWDIIKRLVLKRFGKKYVQSIYFERKKYNRLKKEIANMVVENYKDLVLINFCKKRSNIIFEFKVYGIVEKTITITCDPEYHIKKLKLDENK